VSAVSAGLHHLKLATEYFSDFIRANPGSYGANLFKLYNSKIDWIVTDMIANPRFPDDVREAMRNEVKSDLLVIPSIVDKIHDLTPELRDLAEEMLDVMLSGKSFQIEHREEALSEVPHGQATEDVQ
jgi:hypothetical protein